MPIYKLEATNAPTKATARVCHSWITLNIPYSAEITENELAQKSAIVNIGRWRKVPTFINILGFVLCW
jgi:hypothetical protein